MMVKKKKNDQESTIKIYYYISLYFYVIIEYSRFARKLQKIDTNIKTQYSYIHEFHDIR